MSLLVNKINKGPRRGEQFRIWSITLIGMIYLAGGVFVYFSDRWGFHFSQGNTFPHIFGGLMVVYGIFRVYRGIRQFLVPPGTDDK